MQGKSRNWFVAIAASTAAILAGCTQPKSEVPPSTKAPQADRGEVELGGVALAPPGFRVESDPLVGVSLAVPIDMMYYDNTHAAKQQYMATAYPYIKQPMVLNDDLRGPQLEFLDCSDAALRFGVLSGIAVNVRTLKSGWDIEKFKAAGVARSQLVGPVRAAAGPGLQYSHLESGDSLTIGAIQMQEHQFFFGKGPYMWEINFRFPTNDLDRMQSVMNAVVGSARFSLPDVPAAERRRPERVQADLDARQRATDEILAREQAETEAWLKENDPENYAFLMEQRRRAAEAQGTNAQAPGAQSGP
jgi:hypothetical protein